ncbi:MAG: hypothetical protein K6B72_10910 [Lachnospiraceae bacterium]|nr:hypothetical protein [Lachnospiraceae bacterium]
MANLQHIKLTAALLLVCAVLTGCGDQGQAEHWAYIHEPEEEVLTLRDNGKAEYKGEKFSYTKDDSYITLKGDSGTDDPHRYVMDGDQMIFYERSTYTRDSQYGGEGIVGVWTQGNGWSFQFTETGEFSEETLFFGHYSVDEAAGTIKLMYDDPIQDSLLYYELDGDQLTIEYPWPMQQITGK